MKFDKHIFICTHQRVEGPKKSCGEKNGLELVSAFKKALRDRSLSIKVRAQKTGCLDVCNYGSTLVVYPEGIFYVGLTLADVDEIIDEHIIKGKPVQRLLLDKSKY